MDRGRPSGAELQATTAQEVEGGGHLGGPDRVVVGEGQQPDAVADADRLGGGGDEREEHLRRRGRREVLEEVVLDRPHRPEADVLGQLHLVDDVPEALGFGARVEPGRDLPLVEEAELHRISSSSNAE